MFWYKKKKIKKKKSSFAFFSPQIRRTEFESHDNLKIYFREPADKNPTKVAGRLKSLFIHTLLVDSQDIGPSTSITFSAESEKFKHWGTT